MSEIQSKNESFCFNFGNYILLGTIYLFFLRFALKASLRAERTQGPRRGRICLTAGLDLRKSVTMQGATSKMSHNRTVILVVRPLWGRSNEDDLPPQVKTWALSPLCYESEQARAMQMRPRWGLFSICPLRSTRSGERTFSTAPTALLRSARRDAFRAKRGKNRYIVPILFAPYPECPTVFCRDATRRVFLLGIKGIKGIKVP